MRINLLGTLKVIASDGSDATPRGRKTRALLAWLALAPGGSVNRDRIARLLWSDRQLDQARGSLRQGIGELRAVFGGDDAGFLRADRDSIHLSVDALTIDAREIDRLAEAPVAHRRPVFDLYAGELVADFTTICEGFDVWVAAERAARRQSALASMASVLRAGRATGDLADIEAMAGVALRRDPAHEEAHRALMTVHARRGDTKAALRQFDICTAALAKALDAAPTAETLDLHARIGAGRFDAATEATAIDAPPSRPVPAVAMATAAPLVPVETTPDKPSIAVLAFANLSDDPEQGYFADGIAEELIVALARFREFHVIARNSSFAYRDRSDDVARIGEELDVRYLLKGSVRKASGQLRVNARLIDARTGGHVWTERYDGHPNDVFALQDTITNAIAGAILPAFATAELRRIDRKPVTNLDAWGLVLRANAAFERGGAAGLAEARDLARRAAALDEHNTVALANLALYEILSAWLSYDPSPREAMANEIRSALQALARDGADAVALASLALGLFATRRFEEALDTARRAVASNSNYAIGHAVHGVLRAYFGDYEGCVEAIGRAQRLSPRDPAAGVWLSQMAVGAFVVGRHEEGVEHAHRAARATPAFRGAYRALAANLVALGRIDEARRVIADSDALAPIGTLAQLRALAFPDGDAHERFCAALVRAGVPEGDAATVPATAARPRLVEPAYAA